LELGEGLKDWGNGGAVGLGPVPDKGAWVVTEAKALGTEVIREHDHEI
jgi:hypothetical protein